MDVDLQTRSEMYRVRPHWRQKICVEEGEFTSGPRLIKITTAVPFNGFRLLIIYRQKLNQIYKGELSRGAEPKLEQDRINFMCRERERW